VTRPRGEVRGRWAAGLAGLAVVGLAVATVVGSCAAEAEVLDQSATQAAVAKVVAARVEPPVVAVVCPGKIRRGAGRRSSCRATLKGVAAPLRLRVRQVDGEGRLDVVLLDAVIDRGDVAEDLRRTLIDRLKRSFIVDCGPAGARVVRPGATFSCKARDAAGRRSVDVTVADAAGTLRYDIGS
jgi:hypothetical protein